MKLDEIDLANQLCFSIYNVHRLFNKFYKQALAPFGLTYSQYLILLSLWQRDRKNLHEIGNELNLSSNTLTPLLKKMETTGWLKRIHPTEDKRQLLIALTEKGQQQEAAIHQSIITRFDRNGFSIDQYRQALAVNQKLVAQLTKAVEK
ncbi:MAG: MarR family transcriptional regulator [Liquorilactobacillus ghanensis]|uniref:MarR family winged helix-turn-helix transcriptional regulator n=1 Tax=Liquorilactobacillus ghanensis TaxID=399370 RepID=UPI0039ECA17E